MTADERIFAEAELLRADLKSPARPASGGGEGGSVLSPVDNEKAGRGLTPSPAVGVPIAPRKSTGERLLPGAGAIPVVTEKPRRSARDADVGAAVVTDQSPVIVAADSEGRAGVASSSGAVPFSLPPIPTVPSFDEPPEVCQHGLLLIGCDSDCWEQWHPGSRLT